MPSKYLILALSSVYLLTSCDYHRVKGSGASEGPMTAEAAAHLDYAQVYEKVLKPKCVECHSAVAGNKGGANLETYAATVALLIRIKLRALTQGSMPPAKSLSASEVQLLTTWIENGAPETSGETPSETSGSSAAAPKLTIREHPTWLQIRNILFTRSCLPCHSATAPEGGLDLNSLSEVRQKAGKIIDRVIVKSDMPIEPFIALTSFEKQAFTNWVLEGMQE